MVAIAVAVDALHAASGQTDAGVRTRSGLDVHRLVFVQALQQSNNVSNRSIGVKE